MKTYDETFNSVLNGVNEYKIRQKKKKQIIINSALSFVLVCVAAVLVIKLNNPADMLQSEKSDSDVACINSGSETADDTETSQSVGNDLGDVLGVVVYNNILFVQQPNLDTNLFTADKFLGDAREMHGTYNKAYDEFDILADLYSVKEKQNVLLLKLGNGGEILLCREGEINVNGIDYVKSYNFGETYKKDSLLGLAGDFVIIDVPGRETNINSDYEVWSVENTNDFIIIKSDDQSETVYEKTVFDSEGTFCIESAN